MSDLSLHIRESSPGDLLVCEAGAGSADLGRGLVVMERSVLCKDHYLSVPGVPTVPARCDSWVGAE